MSLGGGSQESILETPTYVLALILLFFQIACFFFTFSVGHLKEFLRKRKRNGMLAAVEHSVMELTLLGFISLCLIALQGPLTTICVDVSERDAGWFILSRMFNENYCDCCMQYTSDVQQCTLQYANCGNPTDQYCNCNNKNPTCVAPLFTALETQLEQGVADALYNGGAGAADGGRRRSLFAAAAGVSGISGDLETARERGVTCSGAVTVYPVCGEGKMPAVSFLAMEQVHLLIFTVSVVHVICGFLFYFVASARIWFQWARWEHVDDPNSQKVRAALEEYFEGLDAGGATKNRLNNMKAGSGGGLGDSGNGGVGGVGSGALPLPQVNGQKSPFASDGGEIADLEGQEMMVTADGVKSSPVSDIAISPGVSYNDENMGRRSSVPLPKVLRSVSHARSGDDAPAEEETWPQYIKEVAVCTALGVTPKIINFEEYTLLRASFFYTHKLGRNFAFLRHVQRSLEDDLSHVVGLSIEFWLVIILFILISGPYGWATMPFMVLCGVVLIPTNAKLSAIIRTVSRRGGAARLTSGVFWLNRPKLLLIPIKLCLFICAFNYASFIFFAWQFSDDSCPFTDKFYPDWVLPWWTILISNTLIFLHMGAVTLPAYSLAVQMGSDIKSHMLPKKLAKRLMAVAASAKEQVKKAKEEGDAAGTSGSGGGGVLSGGGVSALGGGSGAGNGDFESAAAAAVAGADADADGSRHDGGVSGQAVPVSSNISLRPSRMDRMVSGMVKHLVGENHAH